MMDPSGLLTILGLSVAVFAIIPRESKLDLSIRISCVDWFVISTSLLLVHYIVYFPVLNELGMTFDLGHWKWGFTENNTTYLIFLFLAAYLIIRYNFAKVTRRNIKLFGDLFERLILEGKFGELSILSGRHFNDIVRTKNSNCLRNIIASKIKPSSVFAILHNNGKNKDNFLKRKFPDQMKKLAASVECKDYEKGIAASIIRRMFNNPEFVNYLSNSNPYLCLEILDQNLGNKDDFLKLFICSLLDNPGSIYYFELEHTQNLISNNRYDIQESNKLLCYFFSDVEKCESLGVYKPIGDKVCDIIDYDSKIIKRYNEALGTYGNEKHRCPIATSLHFFEIMIIESMHQGIRWHMWLYYFPIFTKKILDNLNPENNIDVHSEWPTPFHFILYRLVTIILDWLIEYEYVENKENLLMENESLNHDNGSIPKSSVLALGNITNLIISNEIIATNFKVYIVEIVMRHLREYRNNEVMQPLNRVLMNSQCCLIVLTTLKSAEKQWVGCLAA